jgi:hypothetical protein
MLLETLTVDEKDKMLFINRTLYVERLMFSLNTTKFPIVCTTIIVAGVDTGAA